jgi:ferredoxin
MRVAVVAVRCIGDGECTFAAGDVFDLGEDSRMVRLQVESAGGTRREVLIAALRCPVRVIAVADDGIEEPTPKVLQ